MLYLSYVYAGQAFMSYQWDLLLLEAGFLAIFLTAGSRIVVWLYRWLIFRYLFLSGVVKLLSGHPTWQDLTALKYHFWTQPLPTPLAWYAAQLPEWVLAAATAATLIIELVVAFLIFLPRRLRAFAAWCILLFQLAIMLTGNYGFFNLLTMALCVFLFDDAAMRRLFLSVLRPGRRLGRSTRERQQLSPRRWRWSSCRSASTVSGKPLSEPACLVREASRRQFRPFSLSTPMDRLPPRQ